MKITTTDTQGKRITIAMSQELSDKFAVIEQTIPEYHCIYSLLQDCIEGFAKRVVANIEQEQDVPVSTSNFISRRPYNITKQQISFMQTKEAQDMFCGDTDVAEFLEQIKKQI